MIIAVEDYTQHLLACLSILAVLCNSNNDIQVARG
jgi:hypothetical protein